MEKEKNKYDKVLDSFCDDTRIWSDRPRPQDGFIYATDTYKIIRIEKSKCNLEYETHERQPKDYSQLFPTPKCSLTLDVAKTLQEIANLPYAETIRFKDKECKCKECNGSGEVEWNYTSDDGDEYFNDFDCPVCDGSGYIKTKRIYRNERNIAINGISFQIEHLVVALESIKELGYNKATITQLELAKAMRIDVEPGVEILIMPNTLMATDISITLKEK